MTLLLLLTLLAGGPFEEPAYLESGPRRGEFAVPLEPALAEALAAASLSTDQWRELLGVWLGAPRDEVPAMLGTYELVDSTLYFHPRLPFLDGRNYCAVWRGEQARALAGLLASAEAPRRTCFAPPSVAHEPPRVTAVFPATETVPANLLRLYLHFSQPMARELAYAGVRLLDDQGQSVALPFVIVPQELWDPAGQRLTVLFDPGRIKRGVGPNLELGPPLVEGRHYTLEVAGRPDATGLIMAAPFRHVFTVGPADRQSPDPDRWQLQVPAAGSRAQLRVLLDAPLDQALAERCLSVQGPEGMLHGKASLADDGLIWTFVPEAPWRTAAHTLTVAADLEDPSGNRPGRPFDVPMADTKRFAHGAAVSFFPDPVPAIPVPP